jgi:ATP synthase protein I
MMSEHPPSTGDAEFDKPSPKVESIASRNERKRWADLPQYPNVDPWQVTSYLISGVLLWGLLGYAAARWLDIPFLTGVGIVIGGVLGIWLTYIRYGRPQSGPSPSTAPAPPVLHPPDEPRASDPPHPKSAERPSGPPSEPIAEEEKP